MIKAINEILCTGCGLCEKICPADIFRMDRERHKMTLVYQADCCNCLQCKYICPVDALSFSPAEPKKIDMNNEWAQIKEIMGVTDNPMAEETKKPAWQRAKAQKGGLKAGAGMGVIDFPVEMYPMAEGFSEVGQPPHARVLLLQNDIRIAIVAMELVNTPAHIINRIRKMISEKTGTPVGNVWVSSTHAFCTPHVPLDAENLERFDKAVMKAAEEAIAAASQNIQSAVIGISSGTSNVNVNNEIFIGGKWVDTAPNPDRPSDKTLTVIKVQSEKGENIGMMFSYGVRSGCADAPRGMESGRIITPDLTGEACIDLEAEYKVPVLYLNSAAADQMPREAALYFRANKNGTAAERVWDEENGIQNGLEISKKLGAELAGDIKKVADSMQVSGKGVIGHAKGSFDWENKSKDAIVNIPVEVMTIDSLAMAAVKTEISAETSISFRKAAKKFENAIILTFVNGDQSYMPAGTAYDEGTRAFQKSSLKKGAAEEFVRVAAELLEGKMEKTNADSEAAAPSAIVFEGTDDECVGSGIVLGGIPWTVLAKIGNKMLIVSRDVIGTGPFNEEGGRVTWEDSSVRKYLNGEFLDRFSEDEKTRIIETINRNKANTVYVTGSSRDTADMIFLLSEEEAGGYFTSDEERVARDPVSGKANTWWLRTSGKDTAFAATVLSNGSIYPHGNRAGETNDSQPGDKYEPSSIRPAMWIII